MHESVLVIDDDEKIGTLLKSYLEDFGYQVQCYTHPRDALQSLGVKDFDIVILDIMLPEMDGFQVCREIRKPVTFPLSC